MLSEEQAQQIQIVLSLGGWREVMRPSLVQRRDYATRALVMSRTERSDSLKGTDFDADDDVLRAIIRDCEWMATIWDKELIVYQHNRQRDELDAANQPPPANP